MSKRADVVAILQKAVDELYDITDTGDTEMDIVDAVYEAISEMERKIEALSE